MNKNKDKNKDEQIELTVEKHTVKSFFLALLLGVIIGLAVIVPGVSGSTVAIIFGMYTTMLYCIGNIFGDFKRCFPYLLPIGIGVLLGFGGGFLIIQKVFGEYMFMLVCLFAGLMMGATPAITAEIKGEKSTGGRIVLLILGILVPIAVGGASIALGNLNSDTEASFSPWLFLLYLPLGIIVSATQIIPGLSATAVLMACGQYSFILDTLHLDYIKSNPAVIGLYLCIGAGFLGGLVLVSRLFSFLIKKFRGNTFYFVVGLSLGSIASMFLNDDMWEIYTGWFTDGGATLELAVGIPLLIVGFSASLALTLYELKRAK